MVSLKNGLLIAGLLSLLGCSKHNNAAKSIGHTNQSNMKNPTVLFVLSSHGTKGSTQEPTGYYLSEAAHPWKVLHANGVKVVFMSPKGGKPPVDGFDLKDPVNKEFWENADVQRQLANTLSPGQVNYKDYDAIHFVGGHGAMWDFPNDTAIARIAGQIYENNGIVSAVCHGPAGLVNITLSDGSYLVKDKTVAAFTNAEEEQVGLTKVVPFLLADKLTERGARHVPAANWTSHVVVDGRLITGQNPQSATLVGEKIVMVLDARK